MITDKEAFVKEHFLTYKVKILSNVLGISRSRVYCLYSTKKESNLKLDDDNNISENDKEILVYINKLWEKEPATFRAGYKKLSIYLYNYFNFKVNHKRLYRIMKEHKMIKRIKKHFENVNIKMNVQAEKENSLWGADFTYIKTKNDGFVYLFGIIDHYNRKIVGYHVANNCKAINSVIALNKALSTNKLNTIDLELRTDNGSQYCSNVFKELVMINKINHTRTMVNTPLNNSRIERFFKTIKYEYLNDYTFKDIEDVKYHVDYFVKFYNEKRIHQSLKLLTPNKIVEAYEKCS